MGRGGITGQAGSFILKVPAWATREHYRPLGATKKPILGRDMIKDKCWASLEPL